MRRIGSRVVANFAAREHRHHLTVAVFLCLLELVVIISVEVLVIHILMALALFARDVIDGLFGTETK